MTKTEFIKEEYQTLREEVSALMEELGLVERYCIYGVAAGFAWLSAHPQQGMLAAAWLIPPVVVILGILRSLTISIQLVG